MKFLNQIVLLSFILVLGSCCVGKKYCEDGLKIDWLDGHANNTVLFISNLGNQIKIDFSKLYVEQQDEANCDAYAFQLCTCNCGSSRKIDGEIFNQDGNFKGKIELKYSEHSNEKGAVISVTYELDFLSSNTSIPNPFSTEFSQVELLSDTLERSGRILSISNFTKVPLAVSDSSRQNIYYLFVSNTYGIIGFEAENNEVFYKSD
ncbi:MAG: hypothetical protein ACPGEG_06050 [Salibacteraceae bacterium]